jgi:hypothetical protein
VLERARERERERRQRERKRDREELPHGDDPLIFGLARERYSRGGREKKRERDKG